MSIFEGCDFKMSDSWQSMTTEQRFSVLRKQIMMLETMSRSGLFFMTINFKPDVTIDTVTSVLSRLSDRRFMTQYYYSIEQRGDSLATMGTGIHSHWLVRTAHPLSQFKRDCYNTVKKYLGNERHLDVRRYPEDMFLDKLDYLKGIKWDPEKSDKVKFDSIFRLKNNLEQIYTNGTSCVPSRPSSSPH